MVIIPSPGRTPRAGAAQGARGKTERRQGDREGGNREKGRRRGNREGDNREGGRRQGRGKGEYGRGEEAGKREGVIGKASRQEQVKQVRGIRPKITVPQRGIRPTNSLKGIFKPRKSVVFPDPPFRTPLWGTAKKHVPGGFPGRACGAAAADCEGSYIYI